MEEEVLEVAISELLEVDASPAPNALPDAIGDAYLYSRNPVFANIRNVALHFGYSFSHQDTELWRDYQVLSLLTLHRIIKGKVIPYADNRVTMARLLADNPALSLPANFIRNNMARNFTLHEAAHCIASTVFQQNEPLLSSAQGSDKEKFVVREILSEAFANSIETIAASVDPTSPLPAFIFSLNSYMKGSAEGKKALERAQEIFGEDLALLILYLCYFEANFKLGDPTDDTSLAVIGAAGLPLSDDLDTDIFARLMAIGFKLSKGFRDSTAPTYFRVLGCEQEFRTLREAHWLADERNQELARRIGSLLLDVALRGLDSQAVRGAPFERAATAGD
jgi:hypothetical protein